MSLSRELAARAIRQLQRIAGPVRPSAQDPFETQAYSDLTEFEKRVIQAVQPHTMTSIERIVSLIRAVRHVVASDIEGALAECGVWKGGSMMAIALTLSELGVFDRELYLYDTFDGMSAPTPEDASATSQLTASAILSSKPKNTSDHDWAYCPLDEVQRNLEVTAYPPERIHYVQGKVEDTIPEEAPDSIALLRLDTDWYESTKHELVHLYPRLRPNGVLIIDDYGHWQGARKAVDEYLIENGIRILLCRIDYTGRIGIKPRPGSEDPGG